jgi:hypothetical protein
MQIDLNLSVSDYLEKHKLKIKLIATGSNSINDNIPRPGLLVYLLVM